MSVLRTPPARWGWHRLDPVVARRVVAGAGIQPGDLVVDLGAGTGALTRALIDAGAHVLAIERDPGRVDELRRRFVDDRLTVVEVDLRSLRLPHRSFRVVANPPWSLAEETRAALLRAPQLVRADLVLPRWLVQRWVQRHQRIAVGASIRAESFTPPAPTGAAVAVITGRRGERSARQVRQVRSPLTAARGRQVLT